MNAQIRPLALFLVLAALASPGLGQPATGKMGPFVVTAALPHLPCLDQGRTGTCWSFSTTSFLETEARRLHGVEVDLSEIWMARTCYLEKGRRAIAARGKGRFSEGGLSHDVIWVAKTHGLLPVSEYSGMRQDAKGHDHSEMFKLLEVLVKGAAGEERRPSERWIAAMGAAIDTYLGAPPAEVTVGDRTIDPRAFADEIVRLPWDDYVEVMSNGTLPKGPGAKLEVPDNWMGDANYLNHELEQFMKLLVGAVERGYSVVFDLDVSEKGFRARQGVAELPPEEEKPGAITQEVRDGMFGSGSTTDDHLMHVVGLARHEDGRLFFYTKDSGGDRRGPYAGCMFISENYVRAKVLAFMVHKDALDQQVR